MWHGHYGQKKKDENMGKRTISITQSHEWAWEMATDLIHYSSLSYTDLKNQVRRELTDVLLQMGVVLRRNAQGRFVANECKWHDLISNASYR